MPPKRRGKGKGEPATKKAKTVEQKEEVAGSSSSSSSSRRAKGAQPAGKEGGAKKTPVKTLANKAVTLYETIDYSCTRKSAKGKDWNFKISSWNVDGLRAWIKKGGLEFFKHEKPDIFCLQETKCSMGKLPPEAKNVSGYKAYWCNSDKEGYAGVALYSKKPPLKVTNGLNDPEHDSEGRIITAEYNDFYVISVYVPNAGRGLVTLPKRLKWNEAFKDHILELDKKKPVIICGDMNVAHNEIDLANPKSNTKNAGFTKEEREGMTDFLASGFVDTFRNLYPDKTQVYTFWSYLSNARAKNVGWRLDYFIVSEGFVDAVCDNVVRSDIYGSDHCPITLFLNL